jgi:hypothetical protein
VPVGLRVLKPLNYLPKCLEGGSLKFRSTPAAAGSRVDRQRAPVLQDLAILDAEHIYGLDLHSLVGWSNSLEFAAVGAAHGHPSCNPVSFGHHTLDADGEVRETLTGLRQGLLEGVDELGGSPGRSSLSGGTEASTISSARSKSPAEMIS